MDPSEINSRDAETTSPTQHAMAVVWGHFARSIGLVERLMSVPISQKTVTHSPHAKILELLIGILCGIEYLTDLSEGAAPLSKDREVGEAWGLSGLSDASGVSRTLKACDDEVVGALQRALDEVSQPFLDRAIHELLLRNAPLVLDADLTGRAVSSTSESYPGAACGWMDGEVRLGYQLAEICLQTPLFGRQWLSAQHHPGDRVPNSCLLSLLAAAEARMGCFPRRRPELLLPRLETCERAIAEAERLVSQQVQRAEAQAARIRRLTAQIEQARRQVLSLQAQPASTRQAGPYSRLTQLQQRLVGWEAQRERARQQEAHALMVAERHRRQLQLAVEAHDRLRQHYERLCQDNLRQSDPPRCTIRVDAGFSSGENLTTLIELGDEVETKSGNAAVVHALRQQVIETTPWTRVGKNAEMLAWTNYQISTCPYPLTVALERFHTPNGLLHAVLIRSQAGPVETAPDLVEWFQAYNARQTIEAGNKEDKTTFKLQHLMSRSPGGVQIQALLTVFAANFVRWAHEWIQPRVQHSSRRFDGVLSSPKRLVRVAANSPASLDRSDGRLLLRFSPLSTFADVVIRLSGAPSIQLALPLFTTHHFSSA